MTPHKSKRKTFTKKKKMKKKKKSKSHIHVLLRCVLLGKEVLEPDGAAASALLLHCTYSVAFLALVSLLLQ
jgi:hypothetical protein